MDYLQDDASFQRFLAASGVHDSVVPTQAKAELDSEGFTILPRLLEEDAVQVAREEFDRLLREDGLDTVETGTRHLERILSRSVQLALLSVSAAVLGCTYHVLGRPFQLLVAGGRDPLPGFGQQGLHSDWFDRPRSGRFAVATAIWAIDRFSRSNGGPRIVPGTHLEGSVPKNLASPEARHPKEIAIEMEAGSVLVINGHLWHSGRRNGSEERRRSLQIQYVANDLANSYGPRMQDPIDERIRPIVGAGVG